MGIRSSYDKPCRPEAPLLAEEGGDQSGANGGVVRFFGEDPTSCFLGEFVVGGYVG